ncbi:hypothetical protein [Deinococcus sp. YIM 77859]|uniref:hypothetical protein n=1 Tax=Deinococcus sp. YIM 77859 TaxID=1540221 RepID=UPI0012E08558|nr:hypothetical protein [Deinococcus sp. YIM 77859]
MRSPFVLSSLVLLTAMLAACGTTPTAQSGEAVDIPSTSSATQPDVNAFVQLAGVQPDRNNLLLLIDGSTDQVYQIEPKGESGINAQSVGYVAVPYTDVQFTKTTTNGAGRALQALATCGASTEGPYYKNIKQGGVGWDFDAILPYDTTGYGPHLYGGYRTSTVNMEIGLQYNTGNTWQVYMRIAQGANNQYAPDTGGVYTTKGWNMGKYYFANGDTVHYNTRSVIGSDGGHYIISKFSNTITGASYTIGYKGTATSNDFDVSSLRPSNSANIELRKVVSLASPTTGSKIVNAKIRNTTYATSSGTSSSWPSNFCAANYGSFVVSYDTAAPAGADTVTIR